MQFLDNIFYNRAFTISAKKPQSTMLYIPADPKRVLAIFDDALTNGFKFYRYGKYLIAYEYDSISVKDIKRHCKIRNYIKKQIPKM